MNCIVTTVADRERWTVLSAARRVSRGPYLRAVPHSSFVGALPSARPRAIEVNPEPPLLLRLRPEGPSAA